VSQWIFGPLSFSLAIAEEYVKEEGDNPWPAWEIFPASPWNFGLVLNRENPLKSFELVRKNYPSNDMPFTHDGTPLEIKTTGIRIPDWKMDATNLVEELPVSPVVSDQPEEEIMLIPMGAARLRVSSFPVVNQK